MNILQGKKGLVLGVANERSIGWGIAQTAAKEGAMLGFSYVGEALERRVRPLAESLRSELIEPLDVTSDKQIDEFFEKLSAGAASYTPEDAS